MKLKTKFNVGDTVYFLNNKQLYKGVVNNIQININSCVLETYKVSFIDKDDYCENCKKIGDFDVDELFESAKHLVDKLMLDFENSEKEG